ncbi:MAG: hypothetical protein U5K37_06570 [Natrialbaceae archaeon]|nr:hypothetical protein [Natrialbaceae archaeon]
MDATADLEQNTMLAAAGVPEPANDPVSFYSPGVDTVASRSRPVGDSSR